MKFKNVVVIGIATILIIGCAIKQQSPEYLTHIAQARSLRRAGDWGQATNAWRKALELKSDDIESILEFTSHLLDYARYDEAIVWLDHAKSFDPSRVAIYLQSGFAKYNAGDYEGAVNDYSTLVNLEPDNGSHYIKLGNAHYHLKHFEQSSSSYQKALEIGVSTSNEAVAYYNLILSLAVTGQVERAMTMLREASRLELFAYFAGDLEKNRDIENIQHLPEFQKIMEDLKKGAH